MNYTWGIENRTTRVYADARYLRLEDAIMAAGNWSRRTTDTFWVWREEPCLVSGCKCLGQGKEPVRVEYVADPSRRQALRRSK